MRYLFILSFLLFYKIGNIKKNEIIFYDRRNSSNTRQEVEVRAKIVVLAASCCETARIMLNSKSSLFPNGIALSPDQKTLYIAVSDPKDTRVMAYDLQDDGTVKNGRVFFNAQPLKSAERKGGCDGMKVDANGNIWTTGPGGVLIISKDGKHLGSILTGQATANCAFGGADRSTLYITAHMFLLRVKTLAQGL